MGKTVAEIAEFVGGRLIGEAKREISGVASLDAATEHEIAFVDSEAHRPMAERSRAGCLIVPEGLHLPGRTLIVVAHPRRAFADVVLLFHPPLRPAPGIHPTAILGEGVILGEDVTIGPYVVLEREVRIGARTQIGAGVYVGARSTIGEEAIVHPNVTIYHDVHIGARVIIHSGSVIGSDGFGYFLVEGRYRKFPQVGSVIIEDDVEIGAGVCIDRGTLGATRIGRGVKIDNLVQIAHNVTIEEDSVIAAQTGIAGSTYIERGVQIGGQVGIADHVRIGERAIIGAQAGIPSGKKIRAGEFVWGTPARPMREFKEQYAHVSRLPHLWKRVAALSAELEELRRLLPGERAKEGA
ncbi:MAG: UDP-3-O-(3-hydroxymyristoyl)glucosamine N-acyltransferase [Blastocatellia bacterium]|nr:UDP-3-O-(3-hydroxymyristoyl)glucosamine N-acyltransferase [Blastocatellia bacterium]MDW8168535.1 UDP-3-O-(3-hydroxymyristoyl)glucosamine N-acyltransferase [Acidobacteriota bacterium]